MTQEAVVTKLCGEKYAEVAVRRLSACGGSCASCESCALERELKVLAVNSAGAQPGQRVLLESCSRTVLGAALLVYLLPLVFFVGGYGLAALSGAKEGACIAASFAALALGGAALVFLHRKRLVFSEIRVEITTIL